MNFVKREINENKKSKTKIFFIIFVILVLFYFYFKWNYNDFKTKSLILETKKISIEKWDSFANLWKKISEFNNIYYKIYLKNNKLDFSLEEWIFELKKWENLREIFESLQQPILEEENITILEWWNIYDIDLNLTKKWLIEKWDYIAYVTNPEKIKALSEFFPFLENKDLKSLEWFLYPETYKVNPKEFGINILVIAQLEEFEKRVYKKLFEWKHENSTVYDVVNLASIVEREEKNKENKKTVAWILKKRLQQDWLIWADASVCYPHKITSAECSQAFIDSHILEKNNYNTRTKKWLPETPIWNPSYETIEATLNDKKTDYWYYLHNLKTGKIYYAKDEAEHQSNIRNYMR